MKKCKDCKYVKREWKSARSSPRGWYCNITKRCEDCKFNKNDPIWTGLCSMGGIIDEIRRCRTNHKFYVRKWWKFWRPK